MSFIHFISLKFIKITQKCLIFWNLLDVLTNKVLMKNSKFILHSLHFIEIFQNHSKMFTIFEFIKVFVKIWNNMIEMLAYVSAIPKPTISHYELLWPTMTHYEPLIWATMSQLEPLWRTISYYESLWDTMTHYDPLWAIIMTHYEPLSVTIS